jgi:hypothetical protein
MVSRKSASRKSKTRKSTSRKSIDEKKKKKVTNLYDDYDKKKKKKLTNIYDDYDKKKKKKINNIYNNKGARGAEALVDKKKKKKLDMLGLGVGLGLGLGVGLLNNSKGEQGASALVVDPMKQQLCHARRGNFADIDVRDRTPYWGLGIEHEMQLFHKAQSGMQNTNILFDSQESTCFMTNEESSCCKMKKNNKCDNFTEEAKKYKDFGLSEEERRFILGTQWELTGRQIKKCEKNKDITTTIKRVPLLMPELITTEFSNRTIDSITNEMISLEDHYVDIHMKNPHTKEKVAQYGKLATHLCGSHSDILIPIRPTIVSKEYQFEKDRMTDYVGSYHVTITLPHTRDIKTADFVKMHQSMAQQIQWLEPLMMTAFFSPTQAAVGDHNEPEGSFRVMTIGWGNFGGSNVRKMGTTGLDRGSNIKSLWRKGLHFKGTQKLNYCAKEAPPQYRKSKSIHTGDFRTFGMELDLEKCNRLYNPSDCVNGRADGAPMKPPFGMEIRIFDHFPSEYLLDLLRIIILIGCNAQRHPSNDYVYRDKRWIGAVRDIMKDGWNANITETFINALRTNLGLVINTNSTLAYDVFKTIVSELYTANKDEFINKIMNEHPEIEPKVPEINRMCWELAFTQKFNTQVLAFLKRNFRDGEEITMNEFKQMLKKDGVLEYKTWETDLNDLLYALETHNHVSLETIKGKIGKIKIKM